MCRRLHKLGTKRCRISHLPATWCCCSSSSNIHHHQWITKTVLEPSLLIPAWITLSDPPPSISWWWWCRADCNTKPRRWLAAVKTAGKSKHLLNFLPRPDVMGIYGAAVHKLACRARRLPCGGPPSESRHRQQMQSFALVTGALTAVQTLE